MNENVCSERSTRWRVRENIRQSPSVWHFFKQLGVWLFSALTTTSTVGSKISAAEFKISGFSLLLVVPEMCLAGITVKQQEMEPRGKDTKPQFYFEVKEELKMPPWISWGYTRPVLMHSSDFHPTGLPAVCTVYIPSLMCQYYIHQSQIDVDR